MAITIMIATTIQAQIPTNGLKDAAPFPIGAAINPDLLTNNTSYKVLFLLNLIVLQQKMY